MKALSKASESVNTSGNMKLRSEYSSCRLFCTGVPVNKDEHHNTVQTSGNMKSRSEYSSCKFLHMCTCERKEQALDSMDM